MKRNRLGAIKEVYTSKPISLLQVGSEVLRNSSTVQSVQDSYDKMNTGLTVVSFGLFGLFAIRQFTSDKGNKDE